MAYDEARGLTLLYGGFTTIVLGDHWELPSFPADSDGDGLTDEKDACPTSVLDGTVTIDDCATDVDNARFDDGCTMMDRINECAVSAEDHRAFIQCARELTRQWRQSELITAQEQAQIRRCAAKADVP